MPRPIGATVKLWMRWESGSPPPTVGMFISTLAGRWYEVTSVRQMRTERPKFNLTCVVRGNAFAPPPDARTGWLQWDPRGQSQRRRSRAPVL